MKLKRSVHEKIFCGCMIFLIANIISFILWLFSLKEFKTRITVSVWIGFLLSFPLNKKINTIPYDEYDNDNLIFFILLFILIFILMGQTLFLL